MTDTDMPPPDEAPPPAAAPKVFAFQHKLFQAAGAVFEIDEATHEPCLSVDLGDVKANIDLDTICPGFKIPADSDDAQMLELVRRALAHVDRIAPGDPIPSEILDGAASWKISPHHLLVAEGRITLSLLTWIGELEGKAMTPAELMALATDDGSKARMREAFAKLAEHMGLPASRKGEVLGRVGTLAKELAYIEALRERQHAIEMVRVKLREMRRQYQNERATAADIDRVLALIDPPVKRFATRFDDLDAQTGETANVIPNLARTIAFIRTARDEIRAEMRHWESTLDVWRQLPAQRGAKVERAIADLYRFLARYYPAEQTWTRHA